MSNTTFEFEKVIGEAVKNAIQKDIEKEFDDAIKNLNSRKNEIVAGILLNVMKTVDMETIGQKVVFTVREVKKE